MTTTNMITTKKSTWQAKAAALLLGAALFLQTLPAHAEQVHVAKEGDTYYLLSQKYRVSVDKLTKANPGIPASNIYAGRKIVIPGAAAKSGTVNASAASSPVPLQPKSLLNVNSENKEVTAWGKSFNYSKTMNVTATAYSAANEENGWGAVDYFGNPLKLGTIAVDSSVIPLGTKVLVTGYSHPGLPKQAYVATASDKGSAIKGNRIDIFIPGSRSFVSQFGYQNVKLYVLNK
ncbi:3D domain-containing protein [Paenibacillus sp. JX-17]|uniref:3D domain-containing protein n=1 Tax=Paenibacillus lacisoli TaxID=3064525 RepID=A0ABT9C6J5_9BACL|nr:3D domain-containing protein [Paenibacillus sp. JX-17]MDO7904881.1 3D domain-containing protein [Paenibacillus sp. JX-17]